MRPGPLQRQPPRRREQTPRELGERLLLLRAALVGDLTDPSASEAVRDRALAALAEDDRRRPQHYSP